jgi:hypothetical protein
VPDAELHRNPPAQRHPRRGPALGRREQLPQPLRMRLLKRVLLGLLILIGLLALANQLIPDIDSSDDIDREMGRLNQKP